MKYSSTRAKPNDVTDPEFRYTESRNPYARFLAELIARGGSRKAIVHLDREAENLRGSWQEAFDRPRPLVLEIGCNAGHWILERATENADSNYIGIDWKFKAIYRAAEKALDRGLGNIVLIRGHAARIRYLFAPHEIASARIFFPDPWLKRSQRKNRLLTSAFFTDLHGVLATGGDLEFRTDQAEYFEDVLRTLQGLPELWRVEHVTRDRHLGGATIHPDTTLFERLFIKDLIPIHALRATTRATAR